MYIAPNRRNFHLILFSVFGGIYSLVLAFVYQEVAGGGDWMEVMGFSVFLACLGLGSQMAFAGGNSGELERQSLRVRAAQIFIGTLMLTWFSFLWIILIVSLLAIMGVLPNIDAEDSVIPYFVFFLVLGLSAYIVYRMQQAFRRYAFIKVWTWAIFLSALGFGLLGGFAIMYLQSAHYNQDALDYIDYDNRFLIEIVAIGSMFTALIALIWAIPPFAYLIVYARAKREAEREELDG